ncbi:uncharacterized protein [Palaemon carinicauda]|uniref:uncharacterized protein n=1 Tax=Palaemon carinicauda TaxID=392227 RepID=UPI0035B5CAC9
MPNIKNISTSGKFPQPQQRFDHTDVDVEVPLPTSQGHRYLFTVIDCSTHWPEAIPMETAISASCTSDRGSTSTSQLWTSLTNIQGITQHQTTAYNPAANGIG